MHKRKLRHVLKQLRLVPALLLLALALGFAATALFSLRENNQKMIELRAAVFEADEQNGDVEGALRALREHVYAHMNTDLASGDNAIRPPIQLKYTYERLVEAGQSQLQQENYALYQEAIGHCEGRYGAGRIIERSNCISAYIVERGGPPAQTIPEDLYKFDFASPVWSPDLAGWSLILAAVFGLLFIFRLGSEYLIKQQLGR